MNRLQMVMLMVIALAGLARPGPVRAQVARFALVAGNNRGAERQAALRYAERDAQRIARLLVDLGGFESEDVVLLTGATTSGFTKALARLERRIEATVPAQAPRALLVVYFSGHADGMHLEFGSERLAYEKFRERLEGSRAQVKIAFVDSCQSGGLITTKGGRPGPAFDLTLTDHIDASGTVVVTSSSAGENSQESGEIQGSFFTHYLLSGLRGAADHDRDRRVTLAEVYQYAYDKTVVETSRTLGGTQHPTYEYQIEGRGKVVLTDLTRSEADLVLGPDTRGEFLVVHEDSGEILAEISKTYGSTRQLALPAGTYRVSMRHGGRLFTQVLALEPERRSRLQVTRMREEGSLVAAVKHSGKGRSGFGLFAHYGLMSGVLKNFAAVHQGMVGMRIDLGPTTLFPRFAYGQASIDDDKLDYSIRLWSLDAAYAWRFEYSVLDLFAGLRLGLSWGTQSLTQRLNADSGEFSGTIFSYGAVGGIDVPLVSGLALQIFWEVGGEVFRLDEKLSQHLALRGVVGLGYQF